MQPEEKFRSAVEQNSAGVAADIKMVFTHPRADTLLAWLADTCRATETTLDENPIIMAAAEGRRQVWVALNQILALSGRDIAGIRERALANLGGEDE